MKSELKTMLSIWHNKTGEPMPLAIQRLSIDKIRTAVEGLDQNTFYFVPQEVERESVDDGSLVQWDKHGEFG